jgi:hypothetical protein
LFFGKTGIVGYFMGTHPYHFKNLRFSCIYNNITPYRAPGMDPRDKFTLEEQAWIHVTPLRYMLHPSFTHR